MEKAMTGAELNHALSDLGLKQTALAELLGVQPGSVNRWVHGARAIPTSAALIVHLLRGGHVSLETVKGVGLFERE